MTHRTGLLAALALLAAACGGSDAAEDSSDRSDAAPAAAPVELPTSILNHGGDLEGHGPRGFAGQGVGLFAGDNLNPNFPDGDGVQIWLTFDLPAGLDSVNNAVLRSTVMSTSGAPFETLGDLSVEPVEYASFEPALFDLAASGDAQTCVADVSAGTLECDVSSALSVAVGDQADRVQFRLKFDEVADNDGEQDLALFFVTDSNTNEPGIFTLDLS